MYGWRPSATTALGPNGGEPQAARPVRRLAKEYAPDERRRRHREREFVGALRRVARCAPQCVPPRSGCESLYGKVSAPNYVQGYPAQVVRAAVPLRSRPIRRDGF